MTQLGSSIIRTAKKQHACVWCPEKIEPGTKYETWTWVDEVPMRCKAHLECVEAMTEAAEFWGEPFEFSPGENPRGDWDR